MGSRGAGVIETVGDGVANFKIGDRVVFAGPSYATHSVVPAPRLIRVPDEMPLEQAAAGMNQGFLAYAFTHFAYPVKPGDWCLVQAAAGGIGLLLCQMAKLRGGRVIGVTSSVEKAKFVKEAGADEVIVSGKEGAASQTEVAKEARRITEGGGVNVVYDGVGKDTFSANLDSLAVAGYLVIYGQSSGYVPPFDLMTLQEKGSLYLTRTNGLPWIKEYPAFIPQLVKWLHEGQVSIRIDRTYPLAEAPRGPRRLRRSPHRRPPALDSLAQRPPAPPPRRKLQRSMRSFRRRIRGWLRRTPAETALLERWLVLGRRGRRRRSSCSSLRRCRVAGHLKIGTRPGASGCNLPGRHRRRQYP
jgi:NADPH2:quinone reductase